MKKRVTKRKANENRKILNVTIEVHEAIAKQGKFGESIDTVLRRILKLPPLKK